MNIIVDIRETSLYNHLLSISQTNAENTVRVISSTLVLGDIHLTNEQTGTTYVLFERKTLSDLLASIRDGRYTEQSHRLIHTSNIHTHNIAYIVEGMYSQLRNPKDKQICISAITTMFYFKGFSVFRTCSVLETAELIFGMAKKIQKELVSGKLPRFSTVLENETNLTSSADETTNTIIETETNIPTPTYCEVVHKVKKDNITPQNIGEILLCSIPGISSASAIEIMKHYSSFANFMEEIKTHPEKLDSIYLTINIRGQKYF